MEDNYNNKKSLYKKLMIVLTTISMISIFTGIGITINHPGQTYCLIMIVGGIALLIIGSFLINIIMLVLLFKNAKKYNKYLEDNNIDESAEEEAFKEYINSTRHNMDLVNFRSLSLWLRNIKNTPKDKSKSAWFNLFVIILFIACCLGFIIFNALGLMYVAFSSLALGFCCIFLLLIIHVVHKKISTSNKYIDMDNPSQLATVISCVISDESSFSTGSRYYNQTNRILSTTYLVYLDVGGEQKKAYSKTFYNKGMKVYVRANKKLKDMVVIDER